MCMYRKQSGKRTSVCIEKQSGKYTKLFKIIGKKIMK